MPLPFKPAICYSGFREGQSPDAGIYPTRDQVEEDLAIIEQNWKYIRLYDCDLHTQTVLEVIEDKKLDLEVMLGAWIAAEQNNPNCPWGAIYDERTLNINKEQNLARIDEMIELANQYSGIVAALSVGNEAAVDWTDHMVPVERIIEYVRRVKTGAKQPVTFCENYVPWLEKLKLLAEEVDFISIHTYPVWEHKSLAEGIEFTHDNYQAVADLYPSKQVVITEAGWTTNSNGYSIPTTNVGEEQQRAYYQQLVNWSEQHKVVTFVFEAFDEEWKGSSDPAEPEKHWGLFYMNRKPKLVMRETYSELDKSKTVQRYKTY